MCISVVGIGNILMSDEGVGIRAIEALERLYCFPAEVNIVDGGTGGLDLVLLLDGCRKLIVIDAVSGGGPPGSLYFLSDNQVRQPSGTFASLHEMGILEAVKVLEMLGKPLEEAVYIGVEPEVIDFGLELSPAVKPRLHDISAMVVQQLTNWGARPIQK